MKNIKNLSSPLIRFVGYGARKNLFYLILYEFWLVFELVKYTLTKAGSRLEQGIRYTLSLSFSCRVSHIRATMPAWACPAYLLFVFIVYFGALHLSCVAFVLKYATFYGRAYR